MKTVTQVVSKTVLTTVRGETSRAWQVPARVTHLVIPADDYGKWIGPPVAIEAHSAASAAEAAAVRTLGGEPYGFADGVPPNTFVVTLDAPRFKGDRLMGRYVRLDIETQEYGS